MFQSPKSRGSRYTRRLLPLLIVGILTLSFLTVLPARAFVDRLQENESSSVNTIGSITCAYAANPASGDELIVGVAYTAPASIHINSVTDSLSTSFTRTATTLTAGSHPLNSSVWRGVTSSGGADTVTVQMSSGTSDLLEMTCSEYSGTTNTVVTTKTATGTTAANAASFPLAVASFTPVIGDLVIAYGTGDPCGGSGSIVYSNEFASGSGQTITERVIGTCKTLGAVQFKVSQVDEYVAWASNSATTTAPISWGFNTQQGVNTGDWSEIVVELTATQFTTTTTATSTTTVATAITKGQTGAIVQMKDGGYTGTNSLALTLDYNVHQYDALLESVYVHNYPTNDISGVPTDNNGLTWHLLADAKGGSHIAALYYVNFTAATGVETVTQTFTGSGSRSNDIKVFEVQGLNVSAIGGFQSSNSSGTSAAMSVPSLLPHAGYFVMAIGYWMQIGNTARTWTTAPLSEYNLDLASMETKGGPVGGDDHYAIAAYFPSWLLPMGATTATMTPSGGSSQGWTELLVAIPPAHVIQNLSPKQEVGIFIFAALLLGFAMIAMAVAKRR